MVTSTSKALFEGTADEQGDIYKDLEPWFDYKDVEFIKRLHIAVQDKELDELRSLLYSVPEYPMETAKKWLGQIDFISRGKINIFDDK